MHKCTLLLKNIFICILIFAIASQTGCGPAGPQIAAVEGLVTLDGKPVPNIDVIFKPQTIPGRNSVGQTLEDGTYRLIYNTETIGALVDKHKIEVYYTEPSNNKAGMSIPAKYQGENTELSFDVKSGNNVINLELKSEPK